MKIALKPKENTEFSFEMVFKEYYKKLVYFSFQIIKNKESAEDIVQDVLIKYWAQRMNDLLTKTEIQNYLFKATKNSSLNWIRHQQVCEQFVSQSDPNKMDDDSVIDDIIQTEVISILYTAMETLPESCKKISKMGYLEGMTNQEIAEKLKLSINTVKTQKQRGIQLLKMRLNPDIFYLMTTIFLY